MFQYPVIIGFGILKKAAAKVNVEYGLDKKVGEKLLRYILKRKKQSIAISGQGVSINNI